MQNANFKSQIGGDSSRIACNLTFAICILQFAMQLPEDTYEFPTLH